MIKRLTRDGQLVSIEVFFWHEARKRKMTWKHWTEGQVGDWVITDDRYVLKVLDIKPARSNFVIMDIGVCEITFDPNHDIRYQPRVSYSTCRVWARFGVNYKAYRLTGEEWAELRYGKLADYFIKETIRTGIPSVKKMANEGYKTYFQTQEERIRFVSAIVKRKGFKDVVKKRIELALNASGVTEEEIVKMFTQSFTKADSNNDPKAMIEATKELAKIMDMYPDTKTASKQIEALPSSDDFTKYLDQAKEETKQLPEKTSE